MKYIKGVFIILTCLVFGYFIAGQLLLPADVLDDRNVQIVCIEKVELDLKGHQLIEGSQQIVKEF